MKESIMYKKIRSELPKQEIILQRIETGSTALGVPDIFYRTQYKDGWIELKVLRRYPKWGTYIDIPFQTGQMNWIKRYRKFGGKIFLFLYIENSLWVFEGMNIKERYFQYNIANLAQYKVLWQDVNWKEVYKVLDH